MHETEWRGSSLKPFNFMEEKISRHKRSASDPIKRKFKADRLESILESPYQVNMEDLGKPTACIQAKKRQTMNTDIQSSLKQEVLQLQRQLRDQCVTRRALEKALSHWPLSYDATKENSIPEPAQELIKEIAVLELEVEYLEQYLLCMYRKKFNQQQSNPSNMEGRSKSTSVMHDEIIEVAGYDIMSEKDDSIIHSSHLKFPRNSIAKPPDAGNDIWGTRMLLDSSIHRSHSLLSQHSACLTRTSPAKFPTKAVDSYHSLPLSMLEVTLNVDISIPPQGNISVFLGHFLQAQTASSNLSLAEHLGTCFSNDIPETPNCLSEELIKCISAIYCELADPPFTNNDYPSSPVAFSESLYQHSSQGQSDKWSSQCKKLSSFNSYFDNPFHFDGSKEFSGPYCTMVKVQLICRESGKLKETEYMLRKFRSLVSRLEEIDPRKMKQEQKLAFWINIHNALVMHAFLVYGIPQNNLKRISLLLKAAYNVGGHTISVDMIQSSILGCRLPRPGQWLWLLFSSRTKFKFGDARKAYAIEQPEPLLHFALCAGSYSDPAVRIYTSKRVFEELEAAKEEYIQSTFSIRKDQKILLPKIVESFAKDSGLCSADLVQMVEHFIPDTRRKSIRQCRHKRTWKGIEWMPHNFTFRYMLSKELA
ncbi:hypothetical protein I3843_05G052900 [Carya illinoinensis]|nr:hypothetical protein I3760_05G060800 [Carya illinoinensis]KAG2705559.1 hypothetical protein I3760_05G060800 [Carya illinoinensis]KAG7977844.1 hypothetical protein I3843_05G052900 [Carya illinoinensis]